jgi:hypothetical protein
VPRGFPLAEQQREYVRRAIGVSPAKALRLDDPWLRQQDPKLWMMMLFTWPAKRGGDVEEDP